MSLVLTLAALELALSFRLPFARTVVPSQIGPVGKTMIPRSEVRWSNYLDYAEIQHANSLGFLDREPPTTKEPGVFRVVVLGDSFVEARQLPIARKVHVQLEDTLAPRVPGRRVEAVAFGQPSASTAAELAFYEHFARPLDPDLVVVVFVHNDFADNSPLLGSVAYGYHPDHPPWPLFARDASGNGFHRLRADPHGARFALGIEAPRDRYAAILDTWGWSRLVQFGVASWTQRIQSTARRQVDLESLRLAHLRREGRFRRALEGWGYPDDLEHNAMFFAKDMPPVFEEAEALTDHAFGLLANESRELGFALLIAAVPQCSQTPRESKGDRELVDRGMLLRLEAIGRRHRIPVLDLATAFARKGDPRAAQWNHDPHWNATGHRWAAEAIAEFLTANAGEMLDVRRTHGGRHAASGGPSER